MRIRRVRLESANLVETARFYADLGLPTTAGATSAQVQIGRTVLTLVSGPSAATGAHHLALTVPREALPRARALLSAQAPLRSRDGID